MADGTEDGCRGPARRGGRASMLAIVGLAWFLVLIDDTAVAIALPSVGRDLSMDLAGLEWVINIYTLAFAVLTLLGGACTDRFGTRRIFVTGLAVFTVASLLAAVSPTGGMLIGMRAVQGAGAALMGPAALALLLGTFSGPGRALALGVWAGVGATALAGGPFVGAVLTRDLGWPSIFWVNVPLGAAMLLVARVAMPAGRAPAPPRRRPRLDVAGLLSSAFGLSALVLGLTQAPSYGWRSPTLWAILGVAAASLAAFLVIERRASAPLLDLTLFRRPNILIANVLALLNLAVMCSLFFFLSVYLQLAVRASPIQAGIALLPLTVLAALVAPLAGWLVPRAGARLLIAAGMALTAAGLGLLAGIDSDWTTAQLLPGLLLAGVGIGLASTPITTAAVDHLPDQQSGIAAAAHNVFRMVGLSLGVAVMGAIVATQWRGDLADSAVDPAAFTAGLSAGFAVNAAVALAAAILAMAAIRAPSASHGRVPGSGPKVTGVAPRHRGALMEPGSTSLP